MLDGSIALERMGSGQSGTGVFLRGDGTWADPGGASHPDLAAHDALGIATDAELASHADATDPHAGYQKESEKSAASGYASLDAGTKVPIAEIPTGATATTVCIGNDSRLSDSRTPTAHASTHQNAGSDEVATGTAGANAIPKAGAGGTLAIGWIPLGSTGSTVCVGNDSRLSDARTPTAHAGSHVTGGSDIIANAVPSGNAGLMTGADKAKLDGVATGATAYTDETAQDAVGAMADANSLTYTDATPLLEVKVQMSVVKDASGLKLSGDAASSGNNQTYGTDGSGVKGWKADPVGGSGLSHQQVMMRASLGF